MNYQFLMDTSTHTHHFLSSNYHCDLYTEMSYQSLVAVQGHSEAGKTNEQTLSPLCENIYLIDTDRVKNKSQPLSECLGLKTFIYFLISFKVNVLRQN